jgi:membrane fusion protein (multidrug efflux system)
MESTANEKITPGEPSSPEETNGKNGEPPRKRSKVFLIILIAMVVFGGWFGYSKYTYALHNEETDDAQVEANISPVIPRVSGYVTAVRGQDNQMVHQGDTMVISD